MLGHVRAADCLLVCLVLAGRDHADNTREQQTGHDAAADQPTVSEQSLLDRLRAAIIWRMSTQDRCTDLAACNDLEQHIHLFRGVDRGAVCLQSSETETTKNPS